MKKRILATLLSLCLVVGLLPVTAMAAGTQAISVTDEAGLVSAIESAMGTAENPTRIILSAPIVLTTPITIGTGKFIAIDGQDKSTTISVSEEYSAAQMFTVADNHDIEGEAALTLSNVTLDCCQKVRGVFVNGAGSLSAENVIIKNGQCNGNGAGINLTWTAGTATAKGGPYITLKDTEIFDCKTITTGYKYGVAVGSASGLGTIRVDNVYFHDNYYWASNEQRFLPSNTFGGKIIIEGPIRSVGRTNNSGSIYIPKALSENTYIDLGIYPSCSDGLTIAQGDNYSLTQADVSKIKIFFVEGSTPDRWILYLDTQANAIEVATKHIVTFNANGGTGDDYTQAVPSGVETTLTANAFTRTGYTFSGWNVADSETNYKDQEKVTLTADTTLLAQWTPKEYTITYNLNGGTAGENPPAKHTYDTETALVNPTRTGYTFGGWYKDAALTQPAGASLGAEEYTDDIALYAKWTPNVYTINFVGGAEASGETTQVNATYDQPATLTANGFSVANKNFAGWTKTENGTTVEYSDGAQVKNLTAEDNGNVTLYAVWTDKQVLTPDKSVQSKTYNGAAQAFTLDSFDISYQQNGQPVIAPINAGTYDVVISAAATDTTAAYPEITIPGGLVIEKATLTVTADNKSIYVDGSLPAYTYKVSGLFGEDTLSTEPVLSCSADGKAVGTYAITASGADAGANYTISYVDGTLTVRARSSGGGSSSGSNTSTSTTTNKDGSTTTTTTNKTTGDVTETTKMPDGTTGTVVTDKNGDITQITASVSSAAAKESAKTGEAVTLPVEVPAVKTTEDAPAVQITVPRSAGSVKVEIPVERVTPGTVAVIVSKDGTEKIAAASVTTEDGVVLTLDSSATVKVIDNSKRFTDVPADNVFYDEISALSAREIMVGRTDDKFDLYSSVTLNQIANVAGRITGAVDVSNFNAGVVWGAENSLKTGNAAAARGDVLKALYIAAGSPVVEDTGILARFKDAADIPADLAAIAAWAAQNGILKGDLNGNANLSANVTRGQACALAGRTMGALA